MTSPWPPRDDYRELLEKPPAVWSKESQADKAIEELSELNAELSDLIADVVSAESPRPTLDVLVEEVADARIMLDELAVIIGPSIVEDATRQSAETPLATLSNHPAIWRDAEQCDAAIEELATLNSHFSRLITDLPRVQQGRLDPVDLAEPIATAQNNIDSLGSIIGEQAVAEAAAPKLDRLETLLDETTQ